MSEVNISMLFQLSFNFSQVQYVKFFFFLLALQNPEVVALRGGLNTILKNVIDCQLSRINEALITTILHLLNHPKTRQYVRADVELEVGIFLSYFSDMNLNIFYNTA